MKRSAPQIFGKKLGFKINADVLSGAESLRRRTCRTNHRVYRHASFGKYSSYRLGWRCELSDPRQPNHTTREQRCARKSARSCETHPVAESPRSPLKTQSQGEIKGTYKRTCARIHARVRYPRDVGSEAQFFVRANEGEFRLGPHCPDGRWGHPSRTPSGESALRWPCRLRRAIWTKSDAGAAPDPGRIRVLLRDLGVAD